MVGDISVVVRLRYVGVLYCGKAPRRTQNS